MMSSGVNCSQEYLNEVRAQIGFVEETIAEVTLAKQQLKDNAQEVKSQIHSTISRQLEILRSREVWLLNQVEIVKEAKEDILRRQQETLDQALGGLINLELSGSTSSIDSIEIRLKDSLDRLKNLTIQPESPHILFKADKLAFRKAIHKFGKVDTQSLNPEVVFADPTVPSTCLPHYFEDYGDVEHHMLYKTVEQIKQDQNQDNCIHVKLPKLNKEGWLLRNRNKSPASLASLKLSFPCIGNCDWLMKSKSAPSTPDELPCAGADASIQQWLKRLKNGPEMEDEDGFEMLSHCHASQISESIEIVSHPESNCYSENGISEYFSRIIASPTEDWIKRPAEPDNSVVKLNNAVDTTSSTWLKRNSEKNIDNRFEFCKNTCAIANKSIEIENLDGLLCPTQNYFKQRPKELDAWLCRKEDECDMEDEDSNDRKIGKLCRANEQCCSFNECCCSPSCASEVVSCDKNLNNKEPTCDETAMDVDKHTTDGFSFWLHDPKSTAQVDSLENFSFFNEVKKSADSDWLINSSASMKVDEVNFAYQINDILLGTDVTKWLKSSPENFDKNNGNTQLKTSERDLSKWLVCKEMNQDDCNKTEESHSNIWLNRSKSADEAPNLFSHVFLERSPIQKWLHKSCSESKLQNDGEKCDFGEWLLEAI